MATAGCAPAENGETNAGQQANDDSQRSILFIAGAPSHGYGEHQHHAGSEFLRQTLDNAGVDVQTRISYGWPDEDGAFDDVDAIVIYANGGDGHPVMDHLDEFNEVMERGVGLITLHYAVEVPPGESGDRFLAWQGGYFETHWSVNPFWTAEFNDLPTHPITRGVAPFNTHDEWYYHMRFREELDGVTPILTDLPPEESLERDDGPHSGNPDVREAVLEREEEQHVAWAYERGNNGRGFGFTGGHYHWNWGIYEFRRIVANAILWVAHADVPSDGVSLTSVTARELAQMIDEPIPADWDEQEVQDRLDSANGY